MASTPSTAAPRADAPAIAIPTAGTGWMIWTLVLSFAIYYFVGVDQGAWSLLGNDMHIHELVHDARHLLGFPCH
ncbi:MAG: CbtB-domain containing protein [Solirubrobacteraceae bacterium]|nr:CbtB-domain containing protein [Patulibacter sp.]